MRLVIIIPFFVLLFDMIAAVNHNAIIIMILLTDHISELSQKTAFCAKSVSLILFTKDNLPQGEVVNVTKSCERFDRSKKVIFLTHGFCSTPYTYNFSVLAEELVKNNYIVFSLDWSKAACFELFGMQQLSYPFAVKNTYKVGDCLASLIKSIIDVCGIPIENITLLGHSLGAHISGFAAKNISNSGYGKIVLIIGLDPAAPLYCTPLFCKNCEERLCMTDAERVVVLHASCFYGIVRPLGHCDYFFNHGCVQPNCEPWVNGFNIFNTLKCPHIRIITYMIVTMSGKCVFHAVPIAPKIDFPSPPFCPSNKDNCIIVDDSVIFDKNSTVTGNYCVSTSKNYPYCEMNDGSCKAANSTL